MEAWFDEQEVTHTPLRDPAWTEKVVFFHLRRPSTAGAPAIPFEFDGPATQAHKDGYAMQYAKYLETKDMLPAVIEDRKDELS